MKLTLPFLLAVIALSGCATTTAGLTKDQIATRERRADAWGAVGQSIATGVGNILVGWIGAQANATAQLENPKHGLSK